MGLFSKSSNSTNLTTNDNRIAAENSNILGHGASFSNYADQSFKQYTNVADSSNRSITDNSKISYSMSDYGAIDKAFGLGESALNVAGTVALSSIEGQNKLAIHSINANNALAGEFMAESARNLATLKEGLKAGQDKAFDFGVRTFDNALAAVDKKDNITNDLVKKNQDLAALAIGKVQESWNNAKTAEAGKSLGDFKYIVFGLIGVFALMAYKRG